MPQAEHAPSTNRSRRAFLAGVAKAVPIVLAGGTAAVGATAATMMPAGDEDGELIRLGGELDSAIGAYRDAVAAKRAARKAYDAIEPTVPDALIMREPPWSKNYVPCGPERDIETNWALSANGENPRQVITGTDLRDALRYVDKRTIRGRHLKATLQIAEAYEAERDAAAESSGLSQAMDRHHWTGEAIMRLTRQIMQLPPRTMPGLVVKARAFNACLALGMLAMPSAIGWAPVLTEDVLNLGGVESFWVRQPDGSLRFAAAE